MNNIYLMTRKLTNAFWIKSLPFVFLQMLFPYCMQLERLLCIHLNPLSLQKRPRKNDLGYYLEAPICSSFSTNLPSILVGNKKDTMVGLFECMIVYLKYYTVWNPCVTNASYGIKLESVMESRISWLEFKIFVMQSLNIMCLKSSPNCWPLMLRILLPNFQNSLLHSIRISLRLQK